MNAKKTKQLIERLESIPTRDIEVKTVLKWIEDLENDHTYRKEYMRKYWLLNGDEIKIKRALK
jgi:hypothetical protein